MALFTTRRRRVLNQWAEALDARTDGDAIAALGGLMDEMDTARSQLQKSTRVLAKMPDPDLAAGADDAMTALHLASAHLLLVQRRFAKHERGGK